MQDAEGRRRELHDAKGRRMTPPPPLMSLSFSSPLSPSQPFIPTTPVFSFYLSSQPPFSPTIQWISPVFPLPSQPPLFTPTPPSTVRWLPSPSQASQLSSSSPSLPSLRRLCPGGSLLLSFLFRILFLSSVRWLPALTPRLPSQSALTTPKQFLFTPPAMLRPQAPRSAGSSRCSQATFAS